MSSPYINRFLQPDTVIPDQTNPQSWNRYAYVVNNPLKYADPTGHRYWEGDGSITKQTIIDDARRDKDFKNTTTRNACRAGQKRHCSYAQNHPVETVAFVATALVGGAAAETFVLAGGAASALEVVPGLAYKAARGAMTACLMNSMCQQLLPKVYDPRVDAQRDAFHAFPRLLDPIIMKAGDKTVNGPFINYAIKGSVEVAGEVTTGVFEIGVKIVEWTPTIVHHFFNPGG